MPQNLREAFDSESGIRPRGSWRVGLPVSLLLLLPCFWQSRIQSIDLCSHVYNAWLASLIAHNQAPGLWIAHQSDNVLFDLILAWLFPIVGAAAAQKIAVSISVLIFSWGSILLICRDVRRIGSFYYPPSWFFPMVLSSMPVSSISISDRVFRFGIWHFFFLADGGFASWLHRCLFWLGSPILFPSSGRLA